MVRAISYKQIESKNTLLSLWVHTAQEASLA